MKKYIFTESQIKKIIDNQMTGTQINEQNYERNKIKAVQEFLNARLKTIPKFKHCGNPLRRSFFDNLV